MTDNGYVTLVLWILGSAWVVYCGWLYLIWMTRNDRDPDKPLGE